VKGVGEGGAGRGGEGKGRGDRVSKLAVVKKAKQIDKFSTLTPLFPE